MKMTGYKDNCRKAIGALLLAMALVALSMGGAIAGNAVPGSSMGKDEGAQLNTVPTAKVKIEKKMLEAVTTSAGKRFGVAQETIILGLDGQQVGIRKMLVPCEAEITYVTKNGGRVAQQIKMLRVSKNSSWQWDVEKPE